MPRRSFFQKILTRKNFMLGAVALIILFGLYAWWQGRGFSGLQVRNTAEGELLVIVRAPIIRGLNNEGYAYEITAREAERRTLQSLTTRLVDIRGTLDGSTPEEQWQLYAAFGIYHQGNATLSLRGDNIGDIRFTAADDTAFELSDLQIDMKRGTAASNAPLVMRTSAARLQAATMQASYNARTYDFTKARITVQPPPKIVPPKKITPETDAPLAPVLEAQLKGQFITDAKAPIHIAAPHLRLNQKTRITSFTHEGDNRVRAEQGDLLILADTMHAYFSGDSIPQRLLAEGGVEITSANGRQARAEKARYHFSDDELLLSGSVEVVSELETEQVERLYGETLVIDMQSGISRLGGQKPPPADLKGAKENPPPKRAIIELDAPVR